MASGAVITENTEAFAAKSQRPDLIICDNPVAPVAIETEFLPANGVENDAASRLGKVYLPTGGRQPSQLTAKSLISQSRLDREWPGQAAQLGIN